VTIELLDTDSESRAGSDAEEDGEAEANDTFLENFLDTKMSSEARYHLNKKPVFLRRSVRRYRKSTRHKIVPRQEKEPADESCVTPLSGSRASRLGLEDEAILMEDANNSCSFSQPNLKVVWVVNSENYIYKRNSLRKAKQTHPEVCGRKYKKFCQWHSAWSEDNVTESAQQNHANWMMGRCEGLAAPNNTQAVIISNSTKTPYRTFTKFKQEQQPPKGTF